MITAIIGVVFIAARADASRVHDRPAAASDRRPPAGDCRRFQLFDGTQAVATGVLRGVGDTRTPMVINVVGHWVFGLPVG